MPSRERERERERETEMEVPSLKAWLPSGGFEIDPVQCFTITPYLGLWIIKEIKESSSSSSSSSSSRPLLCISVLATIQFLGMRGQGAVVL